MGYIFRLYRVIFRPSKTTDPIITRWSSGGSHSALDHLVIIGSVVFEGLKMTR